ncbi:hypothetical protein GCM10022247_09330 [Allokutzneria multivorans]|uniref:Uncharacterized protein n=1 Tax=Allokutzneria multivorans TaxID=1142134 RepID=A0ABP7R4E3_9PSEU
MKQEHTPVLITARHTMWAPRIAGVGEADEDGAVFENPAAPTGRYARSWLAEHQPNGGFAVSRHRRATGPRGRFAQLSGTAS